MALNKIKRVCKRIKEEIYSTYEIAKVTSVGEAITTFRGKVDIQIMVHNGRIEKPWIKKHLLKKHNVMNQYFDLVYKEFSERYRFKDNEESMAKGYNECIWICWWQGLDNAPDIVKACVNSIKKNAGGHKVVIITDENYKDFVTFPTFIEEKYKKGIISKTHLSDLLRLKLLANYGGIWLDSTFYCVGSLEDSMKQDLWTIKRPDYKHVSVACGEFANYSLGCRYEDRKVYGIIADYLLEYWKKNDYMVDYLFLDYIIVQVQRRDKYVREKFAAIVPNNPKCDDLMPILGQKYDEANWQILKENTNLFKLTWKAKFPKSINGEQTYYGKLISGQLL